MESETRTLIEISQALDSPSDEALRLSRSLELLNGLLAGARCSLLYMVEGSDERELLSVPPPAAGELPLLKARLARLMLLAEHPDEASYAGVGQQLALPVVGLDEVLGVLALERIGPVGEREIRLFSLVAAQLGAYLTMVRLHRKAVELDHFKREMFAVVVHDLKNPLAAIMGTVDFLVDDLRDAPEGVRSSLADVQSACHRILRLVANLLDLARLEAKQMPLRPVDVEILPMFAELARHRRAQATARGIEIGIVGVADDLSVEADADMLTRVLENILDNALRYTAKGDRIELRATRTENAVELRLGNTGPPIPASAYATIFEKFGQATKGGRMNLGLGLYFARLAVEAHGGRIWVEDTPEMPTVFAMELPPRRQRGPSSPLRARVGA